VTAEDAKSAPVKWFGSIAAVVAVTNISILLDIPVLRQVSGFIFLTFFPGFLFLSIINLNRLGLTEKLVLSVGLSVAFSMLFGWALNGSLLAIGYTTPLSTTPLLTSFSVATIVMAATAYVRNRGITFSNFALKLTRREKLFLIIPSVFPLLSILGMRIMNQSDNNMVLLLLLFLIPAYVAFISFYHRQVSERVYPITILCISISLVLMLCLRSNHILGSDVHEFYYFFQSTLEKGHWVIAGNLPFDTCLSISILPTIYQNFININPEYLFKIMYPILFSVSPLVVFIIARRYIGSFYALLAAFFYMSQVIFLDTTGASNTNLAILFFSLIVMVIFHRDIEWFNKRLLFIVFAMSCIVSQYSTSYIFFFILLLTCLGIWAVPRLFFRQSKAHKGALIAPSENSNGAIGQPDSPITVFGIPKSHFQRGVTITITALFFVILFFWYSQITTTTFSSGVIFVNETFSNLNQWFLIESRGSTVATAGGEGIVTIPQKIRVAVSWLTIAFIGIGVLSTIARRWRMVAGPYVAYDKPKFLRTRLDMEYFVFTLACSMLLIVSILLPYVMVGYSMERTYFQTLAVLAPFFAIGGITVAGWLRAKAYVIALAVMIPFFMCTSGTMYQVFGEPTSIVLNAPTEQYGGGYVYDQDSDAARWIGSHDEGGEKIYSGSWPGHRILISQGLIYRDRTLHNYKIPISDWDSADIDGYIYLRHTDIIRDITREYPNIFFARKKIYTTGSSMVYR